MTTQQPEALQLADALESRYSHNMECSMNAAAELRRLHKSNQELLAALKVAADNAYWPDIAQQLRAAIAKAEGEAK